MPCTAESDVACQTIDIKEEPKGNIKYTSANLIESKPEKKPGNPYAKTYNCKDCSGLKSKNNGVISQNVTLKTEKGKLEKKLVEMEKKISELEKIVSEKTKLLAARDRELLNKAQVSTGLVYLASRINWY